MRHEHLVRINDPQMPLATPVSRRQLWNGLVLRAEDPRSLMPALDSCKIETRNVLATGPTGPTDRIALRRRLDFGSFVIHDCATLVAPNLLVVDTEAGPTWPASRLTIGIEETEPGSLFLRFVYESDETAATELDAMTQTLRCRAYEAADLDMVACIRQMVQDGALGQ